MTVYMPDTDYKAICDATREKTGATGLLKSYEIKPLLAALETDGAKFYLTVNVDSGSTVVATKGSLSVSGTAANGKCVLELPEAGEWAVTATLGSSSASGVVSVKGDYEASALFLPPIGTPLNNMSWEDIRAISDAGLASQYFNVGDTKDVTIKGTIGSLSVNHTCKCLIMGINHNVSLEGDKRIHFNLYKASDGKLSAYIDNVYDMTMTSGSCFNMKNSSSSSGGWESSRMRTVICPALKNALPADLQAVIKPVIKYSNNVGGYSTAASSVTGLADEIFLLSEYEVFGTTNNAISAEKDYQQQYAYFSSGNSRTRGGYNTSMSVAWWLRSVSGDRFVCVNTSGSSSTYMANTSIGFAPCFCV